MRGNRGMRTCAGAGRRSVTDRSHRYPLWRRGSRPTPSRRSGDLIGSPDVRGMDLGRAVDIVSAHVGHRVAAAEGPGGRDAGTIRASARAVRMPRMHKDSLTKPGGTAMKNQRLLIALTCANLGLLAFLL